MHWADLDNGCHLINPFIPNELLYPFTWTGPCLTEDVSTLFSSLSFIIEIPALIANSLDPDQTPRSTASELGLNYLPLSL